MKREDPRQFDMLALLDPPPPAEPLSTTKWEALPIAQRGGVTVAKVEASYSGMSLSCSGKVLRPFPFRGGEWVNTGGLFYRGNADYECYRIVPAAEFAGAPATYHDHSFHGAHREEFGGYHGMKAKHGSADVVLVGPPVVFVAKSAA